MKNHTRPELRQDLRRQLQFCFQFQFCPGAPRGEKAMLQCYRWREAQESLTGSIKTQAAKANTAFPDPLLPEARPSCFGGLGHSHRQSLLPRKATETAQETKASGLVVWWQNRLLHTQQKEIRTLSFFFHPTSLQGEKDTHNLHFPKGALFRGKTACDQAHAASGWRGVSLGFTLEQKHFYRHMNRWILTHMCSHRSIPLSLNWENRVAIRRTVMWPTHPSLV